MSIPQRPTSYPNAGASRPDIPLTAVPEVDRDESIGNLVKDATVHLSTLIRSEIELAKLELTASAKTAAIGSIFFIGAAVIGLFSLFFFWFMVGEILSIWLPRWAAFTIVFALMLVMVGALVFLGIKKVKKIRKPELTIATLSETASTLKAAASNSDAAPAPSGAGVKPAV